MARSDRTRGNRSVARKLNETLATVSRLGFQIESEGFSSEPLLSDGDLQNWIDAVRSKEMAPSIVSLDDEDFEVQMGRTYNPDRELQLS